MPERVLQFGTGALLRAVVAADVDTANRAGVFNGRIVVVQSTSTGLARAITAQRGLFVLAERGIERGEPVERKQLIGAISRALIADVEWQSVRDVITRPELRVIVSNVTEAGFRSGPEDHLQPHPGSAPASFPAKLTDLLYTRFTSLPDGPSLFVIPTELVPDNGPRLAAMVDRIAQQRDHAAAFRRWLAGRVHFCSSLVDRITTGAPDAALREQLEARLGAHDALLTVTEPHSFWAIESDPDLLREAFPIDGVSQGRVMIAASIEFYRERKLRLLNGAHTALGPLALFAGVRLVRDATTDRRLGAFLEQILYDEIAPSTGLSEKAARAYAVTVLDRFRNPWIDHEWRVIVQNQTAKLRTRVLPSIMHSIRKTFDVPPGLALAFAASLRFVRPITRTGSGEGWGWWRGDAYPIVDVDLDLIDRHWRLVDPEPGPGLVPEPVCERFVMRTLGDATIWGRDLTAVPGLTDAVTRSLIVLEAEGAERAMARARRDGA